MSSQCLELQYADRAHGEKPLSPPVAQSQAGHFESLGYKDERTGGMTQGPGHEDGTGDHFFHREWVPRQTAYQDPISKHPLLLAFERFSLFLGLELCKAGSHEAKLRSEAPLAWSSAPAHTWEHPLCPFITSLSITTPDERDSADLAPEVKYLGNADAINS